MRTIVTDLASSVGLPITISIRAKTAEPIEINFGLWTRVGPGNHALDGKSRSPWKGAGKGNTVMCSGDAAFCQITLTTCFIFFHPQIFRRPCTDIRETLQDDAVCSEIDYVLCGYSYVPPKNLPGENPKYRKFADQNLTL